MKGQEYDLRLADVMRLAASLFIPVVLFAALMRIGALTRLLPAPWPALDVEHTVLVHQAEASRRTADADIVFIGDSSCLMNVAGKRLEELDAGKHRVLNLGTFMYVGFNGYATMLSRCVASNPGSVKTVVVLVHPEMLRSGTPVPQYAQFLSDYCAGTDYAADQTAHSQLCGLFGLNIFQDRLLSRVPLALPKEYGRFYGFNLDLYRFMDEHRGSAVDPHQYVAGPGQGNAEYRLAPVLEAACRNLRAAIPQNSKLVIGLAPVPESFAPKSYPARWQNLLKQWGDWMQPDVVLTNLPPTMPDTDFASTTHLNEKGGLRFTELVYQSLATTRQ
jgi:hypothetical protein